MFFICDGNLSLKIGFLNNSFFSSLDFRVILNSTLLLVVIADKSVLLTCKSAEVCVSSNFMLELYFDTSSSVPFVL